MSVHIASDIAAVNFSRSRHALRLVAICAAISIALAGCYKRSVMQQSEGHVSTPAAAPSVADVPAPARTSNFVPAPKPAVKAPTYTVVVSEVPVKELLFALARDTKQNIDIHPGLQGLVSLNAINETLPGILDRISKQVNMRFKIDGQTVIVSPDAPYMKTYKVNYVNMTRETTSEIGVTGQIQGGASSGGGAWGEGAGVAGLNGFVSSDHNAGGAHVFLRSSLRKKRIAKAKIYVLTSLNFETDQKQIHSPAIPCTHNVGLFRSLSPHHVCQNGVCRPGFRRPASRARPRSRGRTRCISACVQRMVLTSEPAR